jgi:hypothetical protein
MQSPFDVTGLGLTNAQAAVLAAIAAQGVSTAVHLSGKLRLSAEAVSRAVSALVDLGLVKRGSGRPRPLTLSPHLEDGLARLRADLVDGQQKTRAAFDAAARALKTARAGAANGPQPATGLVPSRPVTANPNIDLVDRTTSWDEVLTRESPVFGGRGWLVRAQLLGISARLLLVGEPPRPSVIRGVRKLGHQLRSTDRDLPALMISDGTQLRLEVIAANARRHGWSEDPRHVAFAQSAFDAAWEEAHETAA